jgi:hypothetical protein
MKATAIKETHQPRGYWEEFTHRREEITLIGLGRNTYMVKLNSKVKWPLLAGVHELYPFGLELLRESLPDFEGAP